MYTEKNYQTKKALKEDLKAGIVIRVYQPGPFGPQANFTGSTCLEGPHYPEPHKWYARAYCQGGIVKKIS